tara:strand:- start:16 stop:750 length:735 start_codon:yes stop_codon:yes gene_type:complete
MIKEIRKLIIKAAHKAGHGHIPSAMSIVEILTTICEQKTDDDIFILSKGHGCLAYYSYLCYKNKIKLDDLLNFGKKGSILGGHPDRNKIMDIYASTGSLGHGLPIAIGAALAKKIKNQPGKVFCLIGDGESNEGTIWESLSIAKNLNLTNLVCIVDNNNSQTRSLPAINLHEKFHAFGWEVEEIDGHNLDELKFHCMMSSSHHSKVIIANTIKGKGIKEIENNMFGWHHRSPNKEEYKKFIKEL